MSDSLRDQLLKAGFTAKPSNDPRPGKPRPQGGKPARPFIDARRSGLYQGRRWSPQGANRECGEAAGDGPDSAAAPATVSG